MADRHLVNLRQFQQLHYIDAAVAALAPGHKVMRPAHHRRNLMLRQPRLLAGSNEAFQKRVVGFLELCSSGLS